MIHVIAERAPGDKQGDDISDSLIVANNVALERGRNEIDANISSRELVSSSGPYQGYTRQGRIAEVADSEQSTWRGVVRSCAINVTAGKGTYSQTTSLTLEKEA